MSSNTILGVNDLTVNSLTKNINIPGSNILFNSSADFQNNNILGVSSMTTSMINVVGSSTLDAVSCNSLTIGGSNVTTQINTLTTNLNTEIQNRTSQDTAISASIPTVTSGTTTTVFNSTTNGNDCQCYRSL